MGEACSSTGSVFLDARGHMIDTGEAWSAVTCSPFSGR